MRELHVGCGIGQQKLLIGGDAHASVQHDLVFGKLVFHAYECLLLRQQLHLRPERVQMRSNAGGLEIARLPQCHLVCLDERTLVIDVGRIREHLQICRAYRQGNVAACIQGRQVRAGDRRLRGLVEEVRRHIEELLVDIQLRGS